MTLVTLMTKISQKEYINEIGKMFSEQMNNLFFRHLIEELGIINNTNEDHLRVINRLIRDGSRDLVTSITSFVEKNGIPRKQRVVKKEEGSTVQKKTSAYTNFCKHHRQNISQQFPGSKASYITQKLSDMWNVLPFEDRKKYEKNEKNENRKI